MLQNRASLASHTADPSQDVSVRGSFGAVRTPELLSFVALDADNGDSTPSNPGPSQCPSPSPKPKPSPNPNQNQNPNPNPNPNPYP